MKIRCYLFVFVLLGSSANINATDLQVKDVFLDKIDSTIKATVRWENSWRNSKNYDAVWIFFKARNQRGTVNHISFSRISPKIARSNIPVTVSISSDEVGLYIYPTDTYRGLVEAAQPK